MNAADRVRRELAEGYAAGNADVAGLLDERDRLEAQLAAERRQRAEVYRQHTGLTAELDRATTDRDRAARHLSDARSTISRLEVEATGRERLTTRACIERDAAVDERRDLEQRVAAALRIADEWDQPDGAGSLADRVTAALRGKTR